jgi:hypothetical protein
MKVLSILALGTFLALPLSVQAVPVNECVVTLGSISGFGHHMVPERPEAFGVVAGPYKDGNQENQFLTFAERSERTNIVVRFIRNHPITGKPAMEISKNDGQPTHTPLAIVPVKVSKRCRDNRDMPIFIKCHPDDQACKQSPTVNHLYACDEKDHKKIVAATKKLLSKVSLPEACAQAEERDEETRAGVVNSLQRQNPKADLPSSSNSTGSTGGQASEQ